MFDLNISYENFGFCKQLIDNHVAHWRKRDKTSNATEHSQAATLNMCIIQHVTHIPVYRVYSYTLHTLQSEAHCIQKSTWSTKPV